MKSLLLAAAAVCCFASVAEARNPMYRFRGNAARSQSTRAEVNRAVAPPQASAIQSSTAPTPTAATAGTSSEEQMTKIYGPSILERAGT